eukprot:334519-Prymnesium_polylepis.1
MRVEACGRMRACGRKEGCGREGRGARAAASREPHACMRRRVVDARAPALAPRDARRAPRHTARDSQAWAGAERTRIASAMSSWLKPLTSFFTLATMPSSRAPSAACPPAERPHAPSGHVPPSGCVPPSGRVPPSAMEAGGGSSGGACGGRRRQPCTAWPAVASLPAGCAAGCSGAAGWPCGGAAVGGGAAAAA